MGRPFRRLAVVNRGEPAMRVIHAIRELNEERDEPITVIALYTDPDRDALFVRRADEAVAIGPARPGYLDFEVLERALVEARADAAWAGWGFVAEKPELPELCDRLGIVFVGPGADAMRRVGDKIAAKVLAEEAGVPVAPWSNGPVDTVEEAQRHAAEIGFPLMIKATAGGGGRGIRRVDSPDELPAAFESARAEARDAVGDPTVLLEKVLSPARHVEVQVIADGHGGAWSVGVRDCSLQRRNQKVVEESSSTALTAEQDRELRESAARLALLAGYRSAGTVEFLYEPHDGRLSFMELNARLQVEHPATEMVTGLDIVKLQLDVAAGGRLEGDPPSESGHAIEARLNAEDPALGFAPAPGRIALLRLPTGPGVRVDTGVAEGDVIPAEFDSMIAKVLAWGRDRSEALARLRRAIAETMVVVDGGTTNQGFLLELLDRPEVRTGEVSTTWLDELQLHGEMVSARHADVALLQAAIELAEAELARDRAFFYALARRGRPQSDEAIARTVELRHHGRQYRFSVSQIGPACWRVAVGDTVSEVAVEHRGVHERRVEINGRSHRTLTSMQGADLLVEVDGVPHRISRDSGGFVRNLAPAVVVSVPVAPGDEVQAGDVVAVVESMKMENSLVAPFRARVRRVLTGPNVHVAAQAPLVQLEPLGQEEEQEAGERVTFPEVAEAVGAAELCRRILERLEWLLLGYDVDVVHVQAMVADLHGAQFDELAGDPELLAGERGLLELFADLRVLTRPRDDDDEEPSVRSHSAQEHFNAWLRSLDAAAEGLPERYISRLERALAHYGVDGLERTPLLEEAGHRLFLAQQRAATARRVIVAILDRRLSLGAAPDDAEAEAEREALDRLATAVAGRDPVLADLARETRWQAFDQPLIAAARDEVYAEAEEHLAALAADPDRPDRAERLDALVACPWPLTTMLSERLSAAHPPLRRALLEAMTRRFYRMRSLSPLREEDGFLTATYRYEGAERHLWTRFVELDHLAEAAAAFAERAAALPDGVEASADFYAELRGDPPEHGGLVARLHEALGGLELPATVHRIVVAVAEPRRGRGIGAVDICTFRNRDGVLAEDELLRGLHPMMAHRLELWRLENFALERLPAAEDVYVFRAAAYENERDERLFALAEVRDLTPVRDESGRVTALPELERIFTESVEAMRAVQAHLPPSRRLQWNRVLLHVWPVMDFARGDIARLAGRLAPQTTGLGIEMLVLRGRLREGGEIRERVVRITSPAGSGAVIEVEDPPTTPLRPMDEAARRIISARRRGTPHPAEVVRLLGGTFTEHDLDESGRLVPVDRPLATNEAAIVCGVTRQDSDRHPEGIVRVALLGDPTKALGSLAEPECRRIEAAIDLATELGVPLEWFAISAGAKIAMDSGTENMDWIASVLRKIIEFTQAGGELNVVVTGINVGAQPYWNAEATMLMHTSGILVMTPDSAMVLTGKQALDYSGGVSAEDNLGIGGYERIMGPNGQAQYWAPDLAGACHVLLRHYEHTYVVPGERFPRRAATGDPVDRDVRSAPHDAPGTDLATVGEIFSDATNPDRKKAFDIRSVMRAVADSDHPPLERWAGMRDAESAVVWDAHIGGWPVSLLGLESRPLPRYGPIPADGPEQWTSGTLFPRSSKKIARAINAASGRRALAVLANLAGFDGSPESMREWQLEFGAEIGRAVVNFDGPIVFCVVSRYHGGAFVVFSQKLNEDLVTVALEGAHASVIGGAPAAAVVFARDVERAALRDERITALDARIAEASGPERQQLRTQREALWPQVRSEKLGALADEFDAVHSVERAVRMGSVTGIIEARTLRPYLVEAIERGMRRTTERAARSDGARVAHPVGR